MDSDADRRAIVGPIVGFHDPVRTPCAMLDFVSILFEKIKLTVSERIYIIVSMV